MRFFIKKNLECLILKIRLIKKLIFKYPSNYKYKYDGLDKLEIYYINLDHRVDRRENIQKEFSKLKIKNTKRVSAIKNNNGALGCAMSHKSIYQKVSKDNNPVLIFEDDASFLISRYDIDKLIFEFLNDPSLDILCLAYNELYKIRYNKYFFITSDTQTMSCYLLKPHVINDFIEMSEISISALQENKAENNYAIDMVWKNLQRKYLFALPYTRAVIQTPSYSDIRNTEVNYNR
jgi:glycosyl transferase family 25